MRPYQPSEQINTLLATPVIETLDEYYWLLEGTVVGMSNLPTEPPEPGYLEERRREIRDPRFNECRNFISTMYDYSPVARAMDEAECAIMGEPYDIEVTPDEAEDLFQDLVSSADPEEFNL